MQIKNLLRAGSRSRKVVLVTGTLVALIAVCATAYAVYQHQKKGTPQYSMQQLRIAMKDKDFEVFKQYFDFTSIESNFLPRLNAKYTQYSPAQENPWADQNNASQLKANFESGYYMSLTGRFSSNDVQSTGIKTGILTGFLDSNPTFKITAGVATAKYVYRNYASANSQNYPTYNFTFVLQQTGGAWKIVDIQGIEDTIGSYGDDQQRLADIQTIGTAVNAYLDKKSLPSLDVQNWRSVLARNYQTEQGTNNVLPEDPLSAYGNKYSFAIQDASSSDRHEYVIKSNLSALSNNVFSSIAYNGMTIVQVINKISKGTGVVLGLDCRAPAYCYLGWGVGSDWQKLLTK